MGATASEDWAALISVKRAANADKIPKEWTLPEDVLSKISQNATFGVLDVPRTCGILSSEELKLTENYDATELTSLLREGKVKSRDVVQAFCKRAAIAHQITNCITEIMFDEAIARAAELDAHLEQEGKPVGPLHGLPISLKDSFNVKGVAATIGYVAYLKNSPASHNSAVVDILVKLGAIPFVKTNIPQAMMSADSENNIFGRTLNPRKLCLTAGGSTGGEGALIQLRGSLLGVCTDIAGSCRIPALCNGIIGFKPTAGRIPFAGGTPLARVGSPSPIVAVIGPESYSLRDLELFLKSVIDDEPWKLDHSVISVPWRIVGPLKRKLKFGCITEDTQKRPLHPPQLKMMTSLIKNLESNGHSIIHLDDKVPALYETSLLAWKFFLLDPQKTVVKIIKRGNENFVKSLILTSYPELREWQATLDELWDMNVQRAEVLKIYHDLVVEHGFDGILLPTYQATAVPHDTYGLACYTVLANFLDYPTVAMPYLQANKEEDKLFIRDNVTYEPPYTADLVEGAACGFQVMGRPMLDEELFRVAEVVQEAISGEAQGE